MKSSNSFAAILVLTIISFTPFPALGGQVTEPSTATGKRNPSIQEILSLSDEARGSRDGIQWVITIDSSENGRQRHRTLTLKAKDLNSLAEFSSPAKVRGQKLLMLDRNMWFVKPGLRKPVPLSPRQKLMGGASYGDIASTNYAGDYTIEHHELETLDGVTCYVMDLVAKDGKTTYDRIRYWISKERLCGVKAVFYSVSGKPFKTAEFEYDNRITVAGTSRPFVSRMIIRDALMEGNITTLTYSEVILKSLPDSAFNLNLLVR